MDNNKTMMKILLRLMACVVMIKPYFLFSNFVQVKTIFKQYFVHVKHVRGTFVHVITCIFALYKL